MDLGSVKSFDQLVLEWERTNITQFKIETAGADQNYTTFYEKADDAEITSLATTIDKEGSAQYLRLTVSGYTPGDIAWASVSLYEFMVLENVPESEVPNDKPVVVPELAEWTGGHGDFTITDDTQLVVNPDHKDALNTAITEFQADYKDVTGKTTEEIAITVDKDARTVTANLEHFSTYVLANVAVDEGGKVPPTGDNAPLMLSTLMLVGAGVCLAAVVAQKRKQRHS